MSINRTMSPNGIELFTGDGLIDEVVRRAGSGEAALRMLTDGGVAYPASTSSAATVGPRCDYERVSQPITLLANTALEPTGPRASEHDYAWSLEDDGLGGEEVGVDHTTRWFWLYVLTTAVVVAALIGALVFMIHGPRLSPPQSPKLSPSQQKRPRLHRQPIMWPRPWPPPNLLCRVLRQCHRQRSRLRRRRQFSAKCRPLLRFRITCPGARLRRQP